MAYQASEKLTWWQQIKALLWGGYTQLRSIAMIFSHSWHKRDVIAYPEVKPYLPPRYRGRIVLTRDPDGEERCVACNLCAVAGPVGCLSMPKAEKTADGRSYPVWFRTNFALSIFCCPVEESYPPLQ